MTDLKKLAEEIIFDWEPEGLEISDQASARDSYNALGAAIVKALERVQKEAIVDWLLTPRPEYMNRSPKEIIISGEATELINWIEIREGKKDGPLF